MTSECYQHKDYLLCSKCEQEEKNNLKTAASTTTTKLAAFSSKFGVIDLVPT